MNAIYGLEYQMNGTRFVHLSWLFPTIFPARYESLSYTGVHRFLLINPAPPC